MPQRHYTRQRTGYYCGPAVMQIILKLHGTKLTQDALAKRAKTNKEIGTTPTNLIATLSKSGLKVTAAEGQTSAKLRAALRAGKEAIVCMTSGGEGHYVIVLSLTPSSIKVLDPNDRRRVVTLKLADFVKHWQDPLLTKTYRWAVFIG